MNVYSFDTSAFITPWLVHYPRENFPGIWGNLEALMSQGRLVCAEQVFDEISRKEDDLQNWLRPWKDKVVPDWDDEIQLALRDIQLQFPNIVESDGKSGADPWVVALAKARGACVVTYEVRSGAGAKHVKIPTVCDGVSVPCMNLVGVIRQEDWRF